MSPNLFARSQQRFYTREGLRRAGNRLREELARNGVLISDRLMERLVDEQFKQLKEADPMCL